MTVYQTDSESHYLGVIHLGNGDICPKTGVYLIPGGCVESEPPDIPEDKELYWQKDAISLQGVWILREKPLD